MKLSDDLKKWRVDKPDDLIMDRFIEKAESLEVSLSRIHTYVINCEENINISDIINEEASKQL